MASTKNRYASQISSETALKYGPQMDALALLLSQAGADRNQGLAVQASTARGLTNAARIAQPEVSKANADYLAQLLQAKATVGQDTAGLSAAADPFKASSARDFANAQIRAAETTKASRGELTQRGLDAQAGAMYGSRQVLDQYAGQEDQILKQQQALQGQAGTYASSRLAELLGADAKTAHETAQKRADRQASSSNAANQNATTLAAAGVNPDGSIIPGGKADPAMKPKKKGTVRLPGGAKLATPTAHGAAQDKIDQALTEIQPYVGKADRAKVAQLFLNGAPETTDWAKYDELKKANPTWDQSRLKAESTIPAIPKVDKTWLSVALDQAYDGAVSRRNVAVLHRRGYSVKQLGLSVKRKKPLGPQAGQDVATALNTVSNALPG
jgi:hypothetical protein